MNLTLLWVFYVKAAGQIPFWSVPAEFEVPVRCQERCGQDEAKCPGWSSGETWAEHMLVVEAMAVNAILRGTQT